MIINWTGIYQSGSVTGTSNVWTFTGGYSSTPIPPTPTPTVVSVGARFDMSSKRYEYAFSGRNAEFNADYKNYLFKMTKH